MKRYLPFIKTLLFLLPIVSGCKRNLELSPKNDLTADVVFSTAQGYKQALAKAYGAFALTGNTGGAGSPDISTQIVSDEGNSDFLRLYWNLQELTTDEAAWAWQNDAGNKGMHELNWSSLNPIIQGLYYRAFFQIAVCNDFIRQSSEDKIHSRGFTGPTADSIRNYRAEARFLRAYQYWVLMDLFANPPFVDENSPIATGVPKQIQRKDLFTYVESELKTIEPDLVAPRTNEYGRADRAAAWALLARMYLNAPIYQGFTADDNRAIPFYSNAITYCNKIISAGYSLHPIYRELTIADNNLNTDENILTITYDATNTQNWGGTTYLTCGPAGVPGSVSGTKGSWGGLRTTQNFVDLFADPSGSTDTRAQFYTSGQNKIMTNLYTASDGYAITKYRNKTRTGGTAPHVDPAGNWVDIDFPLIRLGEIYLIYAEATVRGGSGGNMASALNYVNALRTRAYNGSSSGNINQGDLTKDFILNECGRELYWEAHRRTDLIRFGKFTTGTYLWAWKGGTASGRSVENKYNLFPLPSTDLTANPNLQQNPGY